MHNLAKEINELLLDNGSISEYLRLKKEIDSDEELQEIKSKLDGIRKKVCKNKDTDSSEYFELLDKYNSDLRIKQFNSLKKEICEYLVEISDILSLN